MMPMNTTTTIKTIMRAGEMAQKLSILTDLPEDPGLIPNAHITIIFHSPVSGDPINNLSGLHRHFMPQCTDTLEGIHTHK